MKNSIFIIPLFLPVLLVALPGCAKDYHEEQIKSVTDEEARLFADELRDELSVTIDDELDISLWASEAILSDPVGINFDHYGRAWIATTSRRRTSVPDAGAVSHWFNDNLSWTSVEDRREFLRLELASERSEENTWLPDFNEDGIHDWRDMAVERDSVYLLEDLTGNGYANRARIMDWDIYSEVTEITGSVLYHEGELFVARSPDLLRITDSNGDGKWNAAESISHGYGVHFGYSGHGMSSLKVGPAGRIYWTLGDIGLNVVDKDGSHWNYPHEGAIARSDPDGSNFEVFATGLRNIHEFDFDKYGNLIAIDNDGPTGDFDRLVYIVDGSDSGWRIYWQMGKSSDTKNNDYSVWVDEEYFNLSFDHQAAHVLPPLAPGYRGPAGFVYNPGTALDEKWKDYFFASSFVGSPTNSGINAFTLKEKGASFEVDTNRTILRGLLSTSLNFGTDGSLYTADWIQGWVTKGTGRVWKIDTSSDTRSASRKETQNLLAEDFADLRSEDLLQLLGHEDRRVRQKVQFELAGRDDAETLLRATHQTEHQLARIHGIWGVAQIGRRIADEIEPLINFLNDEDPEVRAQSAKMLGDVRYEKAAESIVPMLQDENARVRFFAAEALGRIGYQPAVEPVIEMLRVNNDEDMYLRQAGAIALGRIDGADTLVELADHPSRAVRVAALVALRRVGHPGVVRFLDDQDEAIVTDAARAINDEDFIEEGLPELAGMLERERFTGEPLLRRAINANLYGGTSEDAGRLAAFALRGDVSDDLRIEALETLSVWPEPSVLDRVTGKYRGPFTNDPDYARRAAEPVIAQILSGENSTLKIAALQTAGNLRATTAIPDILTLIHDDPSSEVRIASLNALQDMEYDDIGEVISVALDDEESEVRMNALRAIPELDLPAENSVSLLETVLEVGTVNERQTALEILGLIDDPASYDALHRQMDLLIAGDLAKEVQLDLILAVESVNSESLHDTLSQYQSGKPAEDSVAVYAESLYGGNTDEGQWIFANHADAQCFRCHAGGGDAGPDLTSTSNHLSREQILQSMVDPNARIAPGYGSVTLRLQDGDIVRGILIEETETQFIVTREGRDWEIDKSDITEHVYSPSAMPAMGEILTRGELRDLVEYITTLRDSNE